MTENAYIHIPFCKSKCKYCSFVSYANADQYINQYFDALADEINKYYRGENLRTIYIGGGTPSVLTVKQTESILQKFIYIPDFCEITIEINPDDVELGYLRELRSIGINRISMGSQSFDDGILETIGRRHTSKQTLEAVEAAQKAGFKNISLDLIYGLPNQTEEILQKDLEIITSLGLQHISTYGLKIEPNSYFYENMPNNLPDNDIQADMYIKVNDVLESKGYRRYEISNFSKPKFESKHNLNYWDNREYYGFGVAAHGYQCGVRYSNEADLEKYIENPLQRFSEHYVTPKEKFEEEIFLGFRKASGVDIDKIKDKFNIDFEDKYKNVLEKYCPKYIVKDGDSYKLTIDGVLLSNDILAEFLED